MEPEIDHSYAFFEFFSSPSCLMHSTCRFDSLRGFKLVLHRCKAHVKPSLYSHCETHEMRETGATKIIVAICRSFTEAKSYGAGRCTSCSTAVSAESYGSGTTIQKRGIDRDWMENLQIDIVTL